MGHSLCVTFDRAAPRDQRNAAGRGSSVGKLKRFFKSFKLNHLPFNPAPNLCDDHPAGRIVSSKKGGLGYSRKEAPLPVHHRNSNAAAAFNNSWSFQEQH